MPREIVRRRAEAVPAVSVIAAAIGAAAFGAIAVGAVAIGALAIGDSPWDASRSSGRAFKCSRSTSSRCASCACSNARGRRRPEAKYALHCHARA